MTAIASASDELGFRLEAEFLKNGVVVHRRTKAWWWEVGDKWKRVRNLGSGSFGFVYLEKEEKTGNLRAVKRMDMGGLELHGIKVSRELKTLITMRDVRTTISYGLIVRD